jgi:hypothetical protein
MTSDLGAMVLREGCLLPKSAEPGDPSRMDVPDKFILKQHRGCPVSVFFNPSSERIAKSMSTRWSCPNRCARSFLRWKRTCLLEHGGSQGL